MNKRCQSASKASQLDKRSSSLLNKQVDSLTDTYFSQFLSRASGSGQLNIADYTSQAQLNRPKKLN